MLLNFDKEISKIDMDLYKEEDIVRYTQRDWCDDIDERENVSPLLEWAESEVKNAAWQTPQIPCTLL